MTGDHITDGRERGVSVAITHVLTIGITTILIAMLLMSGSTLLESETERSADTALETIGERLAGEIENVDRIASESGTASVSLTVDHPRTVSNAGYTVQLWEECSNADADAPLVDDGADSPCLELTARGTDAVAHVPVSDTVDLDDGASASGGTIEISYDTSVSPPKITIEGVNT